MNLLLSHSAFFSSPTAASLVESVIRGITGNQSFRVKRVSSVKDEGGKKTWPCQQMSGEGKESAAMFVFISAGTTRDSSLPSRKEATLSAGGCGSRVQLQLHLDPRTYSVLSVPPCCNHSF